MANITLNLVIIKGDKESLDHLIEWGENHKIAEVEEERPEIRFSSYIPMPDTYSEFDTTNYPNGDRLVVGEPFPWDGPIVTEELIAQYKEATKFQAETYGAVGWYDWRLKNYGVKWDCPFEFERLSDNEAIMPIFETPWGSPKKFLRTLGERYNNLTFTMYSHFEDSGNEVYVVINDNGEVCDYVEDTSELELSLVLQLNKWIADCDETDDVKRNYFEYLNKQYVTDGDYNIIACYDLGNEYGIVDDFIECFENFFEEE